MHSCRALISWGSVYGSKVPRIFAQICASSGLGFTWVNKEPGQSNIYYRVNKIPKNGKKDLLEL